MQLSKKTRKEISQNRITYRNLIHWNAYTGLMASRKRFSFYTSATDQKKLMKINTESDFKAWAGFSNRTEGTVADVLNWKSPFYPLDNIKSRVASARLYS